MRKAIVFIVLLVALMLLAAAPALGIVDNLVPAKECRGFGGVGSQAAPALNATGKIAGFPVPNNTPGVSNPTPVGVPEACPELGGG